MEIARNPFSDGMTPLSEGYPVLKRPPCFVVRRHASRLETGETEPDPGVATGHPLQIFGGERPLLDIIKYLFLA